MAAVVFWDIFIVAPCTLADSVTRHCAILTVDNIVRVSCFRAVDSRHQS